LELDDAFSLEKVTPPVMSSSGEKLETYLIRHQNFSTQAVSDRVNTVHADVCRIMYNFRTSR